MVTRITSPSRLQVGISIAAGLVLVGNSGAAARGSIQVDATKMVSIYGFFQSKKDLITELCKEAGIELRAYRAEDTDITVNFTDRPLNDVLERLFRGEGYLSGSKRASPENGDALAWIAVLGGRPAATATAAGPASPAFVLPRHRLDSLFGANDLSLLKTSSATVRRALLANDR